MKTADSSIVADRIPRALLLDIEQAIADGDGAEQYHRWPMANGAESFAAVRSIVVPVKQWGTLARVTARRTSPEAPWAIDTVELFRLVAAQGDTPASIIADAMQERDDVAAARAATSLVR